MTSIIKVDQIQNAAGVGGLTIDSDGYALTPNRPSFSVYYDSSTTEGIGGTVVFTGVYHNTGNHYSTSTGKFTAPVAGLYQFNFVGFGSTSSGNVLAGGTSASTQLWSDTLADNFLVSYGYSTSGHHPNLSFSTAQRLAANEAVYIKTLNNYLYSDATDEYLTFSGYLVG